MFPFDIFKINGQHHWIVYSCNTNTKNDWEWTEQHLINLENDPGFSEIFDNIEHFSDITEITNNDNVVKNPYIILREVKKNV